MSIQNTEADIHIEYEKSWYDDGEGYHECKVTFSSLGIEKKVTISYAGDSISVIRERLIEDLMEYIDDPEKWTKEYILKGEDNQQKLRILEIQAKEYQNDIKSRQGLIASYERWLRQTEDEIAKLKAVKE